MKRIYLLPISNFLAAVGGGVLLSAGIGAIKETFPDASILAFFIGAVIGLYLRRVLPERWAKSSVHWFSVGVGVISIILFKLLEAFAGGQGVPAAGAVFIIALLSLRFGLWFFARALRTQIVGREKQGIALIELGNYTGVTSGLLGWHYLGSDVMNPLVVDAMLQSVAGLLDLVAVGGRVESQEPGRVVAGQTAGAAGGGAGEAAEGQEFDYRWYGKQVAAILFLTVGFQAVSFSVSHWDTNGLSTHIIACFYIGVALAALMCKVLKIKVGWGAGRRGLVGDATISSEREWVGLSLSFGVITLTAAASLIAALLVIRLSNGAATAWLAFIAVAAFVYQILVISLLDQIARAEKRANLDRMVMRTYLIVAVGTSISMGVLHFFPKSYYGVAALTLICAAVSFSVVRRRAHAPA